MKKLQLLAIMAILLFISCSDDHDEAAHTHEQEVFTTMTITLVPSDGSSNITLQTEDLDGDGPNPPAITVSGKLKASNTYTGSIKWYNKTETPMEELTPEIVSEKDEHQIYLILQMVPHSPPKWVLGFLGSRCGEPQNSLKLLRSNLNLF